MHYVSTRNNSVTYNFKEVLFRGFAPDGGLFVPLQLREIPWKSWKNKSYPFIVGELLKVFADDPGLPIDDILTKVYNNANFNVNSILPIIDLNNGKYILELFHGPTWSFKDYSLLLIGELLQYYLSKQNKRSCLLMATSGDTGSSAINSVRNKSNIDIFTLYPYQRVSKIQELQMTTVPDKNVHVIAVEDSDSDELDEVIRGVIEDEKFSDKYNLGSINSINWARICIQMAHWFYGYLQTCGDDNCQKQIDVSVPVGAAGNLAAGLYAKKLGLPINIITCSNKNDVVHKWIQSGLLESTTAKQSLAVAMDIQVPYNVERIIYQLSNGNSTLVKQLMEEFYGNNKCQISLDLLNTLNEQVRSCSVSDEQIMDTVRLMYTEHSYYCCPHTATSVYGCRLLSAADTAVIISPAAPYKFPELFESLKINMPTNDRLQRLLCATPTKISVWRRGEKWIEMLKQKIVNESYQP